MVIVTILVALIGWWIATKLKLPAPAMLGSMLAVGFTNLCFEYAYLPISIKIFTQSISGAFIGAQITKSDILNIRYLLKPFLLLILLLTANTFVMGVLLHILCQLDLTTALLSCVAGGVTDISLIAMDMHADVGTVALMQTSRLVCVLLFFPYWIKFITKNEKDAIHDARMQSDIKNKEVGIDRIIKTKGQKILCTIMGSICFGYLGYVSNIPAASMVFPMVFIMLVKCTTSICVMPLQIKNLAQLLAGALVGTSIHASTFSDLNKTFIPVLLLLISYWSINALFGYLNKRWNLLDLKSALFASAPGGATDMALIASDLHADLTKIALIQLMRTTYVIAVTPVLIIVFVKLFT